MSNNFNMQFDAATRQQFANVLSEYGLTVPQAFKLFANQVIKTGQVPLSFDWNNISTINAQTRAKLRQTEQEFANGDFETFDNLDDLNQAMKEAAHG